MSQIIEKNPPKNKTNLLLLIGIVLILVASVYMFTRPALWSSWDFTQTGQIGDTIGGITAPIINLLGAVLVYFSFQAQVKANQIQFKLLNEDLLNQRRSSNFQVALELFKELKLDLMNLTYREFNGQSALSSFSFEMIRNMRHENIVRMNIGSPIYNDWKFIIAEYDLLITHLSTANFNPEEKEKILILVQNYYSTQLNQSTNAITQPLIKYNIDINTVSLVQKFKDFHSENSF
jgi:hypothetical protein